MHVLRLLRCAAFAGLMTAVAGCAGYQVGVSSLYRPNIRTVYVPMFQSDSLRRNLGEWLTEAIVREIESQTSYKVVQSANADSVLSGRIVSVTKQVIAENQFDDPSNIEAGLYVNVSWTDRAGNVLMQHSPIPIGFASLAVGEDSSFVPEAGQSMATAQQRNIRRVARQIVSRMEFTPL